MYDLSIFKDQCISITWNDIYFGLENRFLKIECVSEFATDCLQRNNEEKEEVIDLAWNSQDRESILQSIEKIINNFGSAKRTNNLSELKWQYCILKSLRNDQINKKELYEKLNEVYVEFNYPESMEEFVSYMPVKEDYDPSVHSNEENLERIVNKVDQFLVNIKNQINDMQEKR